VCTSSTFPHVQVFRSDRCLFVFVCFLASPSRDSGVLARSFISSLVSDCILAEILSFSSFVACCVVYCVSSSFHLSHVVYLASSSSFAGWVPPIFCHTAKFTRSGSTWEILCWSL